MSIANKLKQPHVWVLLGILALAAILRFYKIDAQSLWYDEGNSARIAERSLQLIVEGAAGDIHPPLYYIVLKYWRAVFGEGEAALRSLSALAGVLTTWFAYLIGRDVFRRRAGLIAAFMYAIAPFAVYYGQEARMYALLALCAAASTWALLRVLSSEFRVPRKARIALWAVYVVATAAGLWTQYAYPFVMIAQGVCVLLMIFAGWRRERQASGVKRQLLVYTIASVIAIALYAVWVPIAVRQVLGWSVDKPAYVLAPALLDAYRTLIVGRTLLLEQAVAPLIAFTALMLIGLIAQNQEPRAKNQDGGQSSIVNRVNLFVLAFLPLALLFVFGLYRDAYLKFLLVCVLPMCVLAARGVEVIGNWLLVIGGNRRAIAEGAAIGLSAERPPARTQDLSAQADSQPQALQARFRTAGSVMGRSVTRRQLPITIYQLLITFAFALLLLPSLNNLYNNPTYARDDYRGIQRAIAANARPDDAVIFIAPNQWEVFTYYQRDDRNLFPVKYRPETQAEAAQQMEQIAQTHERLFVLYFAERDADPAGWYERWLAENTYKAHEQWTGDIRWVVYSSGKGAWLPAQTVNARYGDAITLAQVKMRDVAVKAGDIIPFELTWQASAPIDKRYKIFIHIGAPDAPPIAQNDSEPAAGFLPTNAWPVNQAITDKRGVWLASDAPAGKHDVFVGIYDADTGQRLPITLNGQPAGDRLKIGEITIE